MKILLLLLLLIHGFSEAKNTGKKVENKGASLYIRIGGKEAVSAIVDQFVANCIGDPRIGSYFMQTAADASRLVNFKKNLSDQICGLTGGSCIYKGKSMKMGHAGMAITNEHFDAVIEDFANSLTQFHIRAGEQAELLKLFGNMRGLIVQKNKTG